MLSRDFWNERRIAGLVLGAGFLLTVVTVYFFLITEGRIEPAGFLFTAGELEGNFAIAGIGITALGLVMLSALLKEAGARILASVAEAAFVLAAAMWLTVEALSLEGKGWIYMLERNYIALCCISIACFGGALIRTKLLPAWIGWASLIWGVGLLVAHLLTLIPPLSPNLAFVPMSIGLLAARARPEAAAKEDS